MTELLSTMAEVTLGPSYKVIFEAIDPTSGAAVTGVVVSNIAIAAEDLTGRAAAGSGDVFPLLLPQAAA
jgi:hypothetical protein